MRRLTFSLIVIAGLLVLGSAARAVDVTECGQVVPPRQVGVLLGDLDCSETEGDAVVLQRAATLNLNGFSLIGPTSGPGDGVDCDGTCQVNGPGAIVGSADGIDSAGGRTRVTDVIITGARRNGIVAVFSIVKGSTISGAGAAGIAGRTTQRGSLSRARVTDSSVIDNLGDGIVARKLILRNVIVSGNAAHGVSSGRGLTRSYLRARDSTVVGNGIDCPPDENCCDIRGYDRRRLRNTIVGTEWRGGQCVGL